MSSYTSLQAYHHIEANGLLSRMRFRVYEDLAKNGPSTAAEVTRRLMGPNVGNPSYHRRLSELETLGVAHRVAERVCRVTGYEAEVWDIVPNALPSGSIKPGARPPRSMLKAGFDEMLALLEHRERTDPNYAAPDALIETLRWAAKRAGVSYGDL